MSTTMNFTLSSTLLSNLTSGGSGNGVYAYAFAFEGDNLLQDGAVPLVLDGVAQTAPSVALTTPSDTTFSSGKIYIVIQQAGHGGTSDLATTITSVGQINSQDADARNYRFDLIEATLSNTASDVADLSAIDQFGAPMTLQVVSSTGSDTRGFAVSGTTIGSDITAFSPAGVQTHDFEANPTHPGMVPPADTPLDELRDVVMPGNNYSPNPIPASDWTAYVDAFKAWAPNVEIVTTFNGSPLQPQAVLCDYTVEYDAGSNSFWLIPNTSQSAVASTDYINISTQSLIDNIYLQGGTLDVYAGSKTGAHTSYDSFTPNNAAGAVAKYFVAGFDAGFWGATGNSVNPLDHSTLDLSQTWNWNANYAYNAILDPTIGYTNALGTGIGTPTGNDRFYDPYAAEIFKDSNAYGYSYTDLISGGGGINPAISLWDNSTHANVQTINVTLYDLGETPSSGYLTGNAGYVAPPSGGYHPAATTSTNQLQFTFGFSIGSVFMAPNDQTPITFRFYDPGAAQAGSDGFVSLALASGNWYYYNLIENNGQWQLQAGNPGGSAGFFDIIGMPVTADGSPAWYQLVYGAEGATSTYNVYASTSGGVFSSVVADHGVEETTYAAGNVGLNFAPGGAMTYDPATFNAPAGGSETVTGEPTPPQPTAPVAPLLGQVGGSGFVTASDLGNLKHADLAFSGNDLLPGHIAQIDLTDVSTPGWIVAPLTTPANALGAWTTQMFAELGNGTYSAVLKQYLSSDLDFSHPTDTTSQAVTFTIDLDTLKLGPSSDGSGLALSAGDSPTTGNWIELASHGSTMPNATIVAYATDAQGHILNRGGTSFATSLDDAALAKIGAVSDDSGHGFFDGKQAIYLPVGENLKFAVVSGSGDVDFNPGVRVIDDADSLLISVDDRFGHMDLSAGVDNTLDQSAVMAAAQRGSDHPWVYLEQGTAVDVSLAWSGEFVNQLHFVRIDIDPTNSANWSVGGVAYGNTDAFGQRCRPTGNSPRRRAARPAPCAPTGRCRARAASTRQCWSTRMAKSTPSTSRPATPPMPTIIPISATSAPTPSASRTTAPAEAPTSTTTIRP